MSQNVECPEHEGPMSFMGHESGAGYHAVLFRCLSPNGYEEYAMVFGLEGEGTTMSWHPRDDYEMHKAASSVDVLLSPKTDPMKGK